MTAINVQYLDVGVNILPVDIVGVTGSTLQRIDFSAPTSFSVHQNEFAWFAGDRWTPWSRLTVNLGLRFDRDSITDATHAAPRAGLTLALTSGRKTLLKAGGGLFYDRVPLNAPAFPHFPNRTILNFDPAGELVSTIPYSQRALTAQQRLAAEQKLNGWLMKPTEFLREPTARSRYRSAGRSFDFLSRPIWLACSRWVSALQPAFLCAGGLLEHVDRRRPVLVGERSRWMRW